MIEIDEEVPVDRAQEVITALSVDRLRDVSVQVRLLGPPAEPCDLFLRIGEKRQLEVARVRGAGGGLEPLGLLDAHDQLRHDHVVSRPKVSAGHGNGEVASWSQEPEEVSPPPADERQDHVRVEVEDAGVLVDVSLGQR